MEVDLKDNKTFYLFDLFLWYCSRFQIVGTRYYISIGRIEFDNAFNGENKYE